MTPPVVFDTGKADGARIAAHLRACDASFVPPLSGRVDIAAYAGKIAAAAHCFEAYVGGELAGLVAAYCNAPDTGVAFITSVSVLPAWQGNRIAAQLLERCIAHVRARGFARLALEVGSGNAAAIGLYRRHGFVLAGSGDGTARMTLELGRPELEGHTSMSQQRDYNAEIRDTADHKYAYGFDFDVMHPCMMRSFAPFFRAGSVLELGSFQGDFTRRLLDHFDDITCVEASDDAIGEARRRLGDRVRYVHGLFEQVVLPRRYDNIVLTHVLEHLDDPVGVLKRVNDTWLADGGRLFLVCPNANAPSRQIAVKMGLIPHNAAVTPAEAEHGHRRTYALDTLERDALAAGLRVAHRSGIFFKALANFQWDRLLLTDIVSKEYLDGCYMLGQQYPDLCASIFLMCEKGPPRA